MNDGRAKWHQMTVETVCEQLHTNATVGLTRRAARSRFKKEGANTLFDRKRTSTAAVLHPLLCDPAFLLMLFGAILALCFAKIATSVAFVAVLIVCAGFIWYVVQRWHRTEERIVRYRIPTVRAVRDGALYTISARRVVRGDVLLLQAGDIVPCDCRILSACNARVLTLTPSDDGKALYTESIKNAETVYPYATSIALPQCENMLCGGSEILSGEVRAVAVEIGVHTFIGAMTLFSVPSEPQRKRRDDTSLALAPYLRAWGIVTILCMIPLTFVALLRAPNGLDMIDVFFSLCTWVGCASPAVLALYVRLASMRASTDCFGTVPHENRMILKSARAADTLATVTDILVLGRAGTSDGVPHLARAVIGQGEQVLDPNTPQSSLQPLCEAFFLLKMASEGSSVTMTDRGEDDTAFLSELLAVSAFDLPALRVRLSHATMIPRQDGVREVAVETKERTFGLLFSESVRISDRCMVYADGERYRAVTPTLRETLHTFEREAHATAAKTITVLRRMRDGTPALLGVVAIREEMQAVLPSVREELAQSGVNTYFFFQADETAYAAACRLPEPYIRKDKPDAALTFAQLQRGRVFLGFTASDVADLLSEMRREGRRVALLGVNAEHALLRGAPLLIACDPTDYHRRSTEEAALEQQPPNGRENSTICTQTLRRRADVLISRAEKSAGGLAAVLEGLAHARAIRYRARLLIAFLCTSQLFRLAWCLLAAVLGTGLPNGALMLYAGGWAQTVGALWILWLPVPQNRLRRLEPLDESALAKLFFAPERVFPPLVATVGTVLCAAILMWCGVIAPNVASTYCFTSVLVIETLLLYDTVHKKHAPLRPLQRLLPSLLIWLPVCVFLPVMHFAVARAWSLATLFLLPLSPILYLLAGRCLSVFRRTAK